MTSYHLRSFTPAYLEPVWSLVQRTIGISYAPDYSPEVIKFFQDYHPREKILDDAENGHILVAERDGTIIGTGTLREAHIRRVFIEPGCQGQGIGRVIATHLEEPDDLRVVVRLVGDTDGPLHQRPDRLEIGSCERAKIEGVHFLNLVISTARPELVEGRAVNML